MRLLKLNDRISFSSVLKFEKFTLLLRKSVYPELHLIAQPQPTHTDHSDLRRRTGFPVYSKVGGDTNFPRTVLSA